MLLKIQREFAKEIAKIRPGVSDFCFRCHTTKPLAELYIYYYKDGHKICICILCQRLKNQLSTWRRRGIEPTLSNEKRLALYKKRFKQQKGCCAICGVPQAKLKRALDFDHNRKTGKARGLLCCICNRVLVGTAENAPDRFPLLRPLNAYLKKWNIKPPKIGKKQNTN